MTLDTHIRSISAKVPKYSRNFNEILRNEFLYEGRTPSDADYADYYAGRPSIKAVRVG